MTVINHKSIGPFLKQPICRKVRMIDSFSTKLDISIYIPSLETTLNYNYEVIPIFPHFRYLQFSRGWVVWLLKLQSDVYRWPGFQPNSQIHHHNRLNSQKLNWKNNWKFISSFYIFLQRIGGWNIDAVHSPLRDRHVSFEDAV